MRIHAGACCTHYTDDCERHGCALAPAFEDTGSLPVVADGTKLCDTCGKVHGEADCDHSEVL